MTLRFLSHRNYKRSRKKTFCFHSQSSCYSRVVAFSFFLMYSDLLIDVFQYLERNEIEKGRYVSRYWNFTVRNSYLNNAFVIYRLSFKYEPVSPNLQEKSFCSFHLHTIFVVAMERVGTNNRAMCFCCASFYKTVWFS